ncbi:MAG: MgtC/SapB family protein [Flavobacteriales bacterium]|nr:MgtC/SapB family protein [Flavobacteriales bacterium]
MEIQEFALRLLIATGSGLVIGFERRWNHKSAGLRTNTLVAIGSAMFVMLSINLTEEGGDVTRIIGQVVTGIGFLGAGIIFKEGINIYGLTTAATIWCSCAVGCMAAAGLYIETVICVTLIVLVNTLLKLFDNWLIRKMNKRGKNDDEG